MSAFVQQNFLRSTTFDDNWIANYANPGAAGVMPALLGTTDGFSPAYPPVPGGSNPLQQGNILSALVQLMQTLTGMLAQLLGGQGTGAGQASFGNATISSTGDPHIALSGTLANGTGVATKYDDMQSDPDLVRSGSFPGGYRVSTQTTQPAANGVTFNQSATVTTGFGQNQVTFDKDGNATILQGGVPIAIGAGQTVDLGCGESVTDNGNSLVVNDTAANGGQITTTMSQNGSGVDVTVNAANVDLGGDAVRNALGKGVRPSAGSAA